MVTGELFQHFTTLSKQPQSAVELWFGKRRGYKLPQKSSKTATRWPPARETILRLKVSKWATYSGTLGLAPHAYDPVINEKEPPDVRRDLLRYPDGKGKPRSALPWRGFINVGVLVMLISGLQCFLTLIRNNVQSRHIQ